MRKSAAWMQLVDERILEYLNRVVWSSAEMMVLVSQLEEIRPSVERLEGRLDAKYLAASTG